MLGWLLLGLVFAGGWVLVVGCGRNRHDPDELGPLTRPSYFDQPAEQLREAGSRQWRHHGAPVR